jgi:hypothetical protein
VDNLSGRHFPIFHKKYELSFCHYRVLVRRPVSDPLVEYIQPLVSGLHGAVSVIGFIDK